MNTCEARLGWQAVEWGEAPRYCTQTVGLRVIVAADGSQHHYCPRLGHRERVEAQVRRLTRTRCHCGSLLTAGGCTNADCGNWRGPVAAA